MKKIISILLVAALLTACDSNKGNDQKPSSDTVSEKHEAHEEKAGVLKLNNGAKWKADSTTLMNVSLLKNIVSGAKKESLENYIQTAAQLQDGLNKMINECKMKGADHEALHHWLEPLIEKTKELKNVSSIETAGTISGEIEKQINLFSQYFE